VIPVQWQKVRRDLLNEGVRTGLVISAIAVGIFGFAAEGLETCDISGKCKAAIADRQWREWINPGD